MESLETILILFKFKDQVNIAVGSITANTPYLFGYDVVAGAGGKTMDYYKNRFNGPTNDTDGAGSVTWTTPNLGAVNGNANATDGFKGTMGEVIMYDTNLLDADRNKIFSYLAIKYGITMRQNDADGLGIGDYVASDGTVIFDAPLEAATAFNNDIAVIGLDGASGLNQKQSKSGNANGIVAMGLATIEANNTANSATFSNKNFMTWANNDGAATWTETGAPTDFQILEKQWQVQEVGNVGAVAMQFDVADTDFDVANLINGTSYYLVYDANDNDDLSDDTPVELTNSSGDIWETSTAINFTTGMEFSLATADPPTPGGVSGNLALWLKADVGGAAWTDQSGNATTVTAVGSPTLNANSLNFNDQLAFNGSTDYYELTNAAFANGTGDKSFYVVASRMANTGAEYMLALGNTTGTSTATAFGHWANEVGSPFLSRGGLEITSSDVAWAVNESIIANYSYIGGANALENNGRNLVLNQDEYALNLQNGNIGKVGNYINPVAAVAWSGSIAEVIVYNSGTSGTQKQQIESYLAIKYGITLDGGEYLSNTGSTLLDTGVTGYAFNVTGTGQDDVSALTQPKSKGVNGIVTIDQGTTTNGVFQFIADDNGAVAAFDATGSTAGFEKLVRTWRYDEVGAVGATTISIAATDLPTVTGDLYLLSGTDLSSATTTAMTLTAGVYSVSIDLADDALFSFGINASEIVLTQIGNEGDNPDVANSVVTVAQINTIVPAITDADAGNETEYQDYIDANPDLFDAPATAAQVQAMVTAVNTAVTASDTVLTQIGNEGDNPDVANSVVTVAQINMIVPAITDADAGNETEYQDYIDANPDLFDAPATAAQVQAMITAVNAAVTAASDTVLTQIGNEGDNPDVANSVVTVAQINMIVPAITDADAGNETAYQDYIDANPDLFDAPATAAQVQAMVTAVNTAVTAASDTVLTQIGNEGDNPDVANSVVTVAQINMIVPAITDADVANEGEYQDYIDANPDLFDAPATAAQVQAMITAVNTAVTASDTVLTQIGNEGDNPDVANSVVTVAQINTIVPAITDADVANETEYQDYIDANPDLFDAPATAAQVQAMITAVNTAVTASDTVLTQIGNEGDNPDVANSVVTVAQINTILPAITDADVANETEYQDYIDANPDLFDAPATAAQVQAMITAVNTAVTASDTVLTQIGNEGDNPDVANSVVTVAQINTIVPAITDADVANETEYQDYIDANPDLFDAPATAAQVQAMVTAVNTGVSASDNVLIQIGNEGDNPDVVDSVVTAVQINMIVPAITGVDPTNEGEYQDYIDANPDLFDAPATAAQVQAMITAVNTAVTASDTVLTQIGNEGDNPDVANSVVTVAQINTIVPAITDADVANETEYQDYIDANPDLFDAPATAAQVQAMITAVNTAVTASDTVLTQIGNEGDNPDVANSVVTVAQINTIVPAITDADVANEGEYQDYIDANPDLFDAPATAAQVQAMITAVNTAVTASDTVLTQIGNEGDNPDVANSVVTVAQINTILPAITDADVANEGEYQDYIDANPDLFDSPATAAQVQAMVTAVNTGVSASDNVLIQIGNEGDNPDVVDSVVTAVQINMIVPAITGVDPTNEGEYQDYIDANPDLFDAPATAAQVQAMITAVNTAVTASDTVLTQIGNEGDNPDVVDSVVTVAQINTIVPAITGVDPTNEGEYQDYIDANPDLFDAPATAAQVQAMITAVNTAVTASDTVLTQIGNEGDNPDVVDSVVTVAQINTIVPAITGVDPANEGEYQDYIDANPDLFDAPATAAQVQAMITAVNTAVTASDTVLTQIGNEGDNPDVVDSVVTVAQINTILPAITDADVANETDYQDYIDANPDLFDAPATAAQVQAMVTAVNTGVSASDNVLIQIGNEGDNPDTVDSVVTAAQINMIVPAITGVDPANEGEYQDYIDANPDLFDSPATATQIQDMVTAVNTAVTASETALSEVLEDSASTGGDNNTNGVAVTATQLSEIIGVTGVDPANESAYQTVIAAETGFSNPPTAAEVQAIIDEVNSVAIVVASSSPNVLTQQELTDAGITQTGLTQVELDAIALAVSTASPAPVTTEELQALVDMALGTLGTLDVSLEAFNMYPNPTTGSVTISIEVESVIVFDIQGRKVYETTNNTFDVSRLDSGVYSVAIKTNKGKTTRRLIKK